LGAAACVLTAELLFSFLKSGPVHTRGLRIASLLPVLIAFLLPQTVAAGDLGAVLAAPLTAFASERC
jgi:hypothetical protein